LLLVMVKVKAAPPTVALVGEIEAIAGAAGGEMMKIVVALPPPGAGLTTPTCWFPVAPRSAAEIAAVSCEEVINLVGLVCPFQVMLELATKPDPFIVRMKPSVPAAAVSGEIDWICGAGAGAGGGGLPEPPHPLMIETSMRESGSARPSEHFGQGKQANAWSGMG
jgi:hypothetical protein